MMSIKWINGRIANWLPAMAGIVMGIGCLVSGVRREWDFLTPDT